MNGAKIALDSGVNIPNNITLTTVRSVAGNGAISSNGDVTATWSGSITKNGASSSGGEFVGPVGATTTNYLILSGPIINNLASVAKNAGNVSNVALQIRAGNVRMADTTGTSSTFRIEDRDGILQVGANNGIATNAYVDIGGNLGNPGGPTAVVLDLNGFNQQLVGVSNYLSNTQSEIIRNSSTTSPAVLTLAPANPTSNPNQALLVFTANANGSGTNAIMTDASAAAPLSLVVNGDAAGVQYMVTGASSYRGTTTLTSGTLAVSSLANGGANSSIGASSNAAANLVFNGGGLRYVNTSLNNANGAVALTNSTTPSTDRNFTINNGASGTLDVEAAGTTLTWSGGSLATTGSLVKAGAGTLILTGTNQHTGGTTINGGTLLVNSPGSLAAGNVSVANLAKLGGNGTIGGQVTPASGGIVAPGVPGTNNGLGTIAVDGLTMNTGAVLQLEITDTSNLDKINITGNATFNGGNVFLFQPGTTTSFNAPAGTSIYPLFTVGGAISGSLNNLTISNPQAGKLYTLAGTSTINLTIADGTTSEWNNAGGTGLWTTSGNWTNGVPNAVGVSAKFGQLTSGSVDLNGSKTVSGVTFDNAAGYVLTGNSSTLNLNNGVAAAAITVVSGSHTISVPVAASNASSVSFTSTGTALTLSGAFSGGKPISVSGTGGTLTLTANNSYTSTTLDAATLNVGTFGGADTTGSLGSGDITISHSATLNFNRSNAYGFAGGIAGSGVGAGSVNFLGSGTTTISGPISNITSLNASAGTVVASSTISQTDGINLTGSASMAANGSISGTGGLNMSSTGTLNLNASNSYFVGNATTAGTTITNGTVNLNAAGALPANSAMAVSGGTLNLNGNNISLSNILDGSSGGAITNNGPANSTSTIAFTGNANNYDMFAALNDGAGGGKVALVTSINNSQSGNIFILHLHSPGTYSGGTTVNSQNIQADASNAFGTGPIHIVLNNSSTSSSEVFLAPGVTIGNAITIDQGHPVQVNITTTQGVIQQTAGGLDATVTGPITQLANNINGGLFKGPTPVGGTDFLNVNGPVIANYANSVVIQIDGNVRYGDTSGNSNYGTIQLNGQANLAANNALCQTAVINVANFFAGTFETNGFNQTAATLFANTGNAATVQNSSGVVSTVTLNTTAATDAANTNVYNGAINGNINLIVAGVGTEKLTGTNSNYTGVTTLGGTAVLEAAAINAGGSPGSIGAATNAASNLLFDGGTLRYTGATANTDRGFTITNTVGTTAKIDVATGGTNLTWSGSSGASSGGLTKLGPGTLTIDATASHGYTGATIVSAGTLAVNNALTSTSSISISSGAFLTGSGSIGGSLTHTAGTINPGVVGGTSAGTLTFTGPMTLNGGTVQYDVDGSQLANPLAQDLVKANGGLTITSATIDLEFLPPASPPASAFDYTLFTYNGTAPSVTGLSFITNVPGRNTYTASATAGQVKVHVVPGISANLIWNSTSSGAWDVNTTANWLNGAAQDKFQNGDNATFADGASLQTAITLNGTVSPNSVSVTSNTNNYTISGTGKISGLGTLTKSGNSTLTLKTNNDYSGNTTISGGVVNVGGSSTSGSLGTGIVTNNASLIFSRTDGNAITPLVIPNAISGTGSLTLSLNGTANMTGATISQASIVGNGLGTANLSGMVTTSGDFILSSGNINISNAGSLTVGGGISASGSGALTVGSSTTATGGVTTSGSASVTLTGGLAGAGGITQGSTGFVTVGGTSSYMGNTVINNGTFFTNDASALGDTNGTTMVNAPGSLFVVAQNADYGTEQVTINGTGTANNGAAARRRNHHVNISKHTCFGIELAHQR